MTTFFAMMINIIDVASNFRDVTNFYVQISLNFLLGGITLVGASLQYFNRYLDKVNVRQNRRLSPVRKAKVISRVSRKKGGHWASLWTSRMEIFATGLWFASIV